jgi:hypothetical protein
MTDTLVTKEKRHADVQALISEYGIGDFYRTFRIGESIDATKISADLPWESLRIGTFLALCY